jgi:hypothetical protein
MIGSLQTAPIRPTSAVRDSFARVVSPPQGADWEAVGAIAGAAAALFALLAIIQVARIATSERKDRKRVALQNYYRTLLTDPGIAAISVFVVNVGNLLIAVRETIREQKSEDARQSEIAETTGRAADEFNSEYYALAAVLNRGATALKGRIEVLLALSPKLENLQDELVTEIRRLPVTPDDGSLDRKLQDHVAGIMKLIMDHDPTINI